MKVNLQFIADEAKVSKSLVSKVLNEKDVRVSPKTRKLILDIANKFNYTPDRMALGLRMKRTNMLGLILPNISFNFFGRLAYAVEVTARKYNYNVFLCNTSEDVMLERNYLEEMSKMVDGILISPSDNAANLDIFKTIKEHECPFVFIDRYITGLDASFVTTDSFWGAKVVTEKLIEKGHRKILFLSHSKSPYTSVQIDRYAGYRQAMLENGLKESWEFVSDEIDIENQTIHNILLAPDRPSAIVMVSSWDINLILSLCAKLGLVIPRDVELALFDRFWVPYTTAEEMRNAQIIKKPLLIMEQDPEQMGRRGVEILLEKIETKDDQKREVFLKPVFIGLEEQISDPVSDASLRKID